MILRSLMEHISEQNWLAVGPDLAIVIIGVFIGIQVSNRNPARQVAAADSVTRQRLTGTAQ